MARAFGALPLDPTRGLTPPGPKQCLMNPSCVESMHYVMAKQWPAYIVPRLIFVPLNWYGCPIIVRGVSREFLGILLVSKTICFSVLQSQIFFNLILLYCWKKFGHQSLLKFYDKCELYDITGWVSKLLWH